MIFLASTLLSEGLILALSYQSLSFTRVLGYVSAALPHFYDCKKRVVLSVTLVLRSLGRCSVRYENVWTRSKGHVQIKVILEGSQGRDICFFLGS